PASGTGTPPRSTPWPSRTRRAPCRRARRECASAPHPPPAAPLPSSLRETLLANQRSGQALRVMHVVVAIATLDAQALMVRRAVAAFDSYDLVVLDVIVELAADAAVRTDRWDDLVGDDQIGVVRRRQRPRGAGLHAFAAGDASRHSHRVAKIEHDRRVGA